MGLSSVTGPAIGVSFASNQDARKEIILKGFVKSFHPIQNTIPTLKRGYRDSEEFSSKVLPVIPLNRQGEAKIKINGKPWQILVDTGATLIKSHSEACRRDAWKLAEVHEGQEFLPEAALPDLLPGQERKVKFHTSFPFPIQTIVNLIWGYPLIIDPFSPKKLMPSCLSHLYPENLAWPSACLGQGCCQFLSFVPLER